MPKSNESSGENVSNESARRLERLNELRTALDVLVAAEVTSSEVDIDAADEYTRRQERKTRAGQALGEVFSASRVAHPMLWDMVGYVHGVDQEDLAAQFGEMRMSRQIVPDGLSFRLVDGSAELPQD